MFFEIESGPYKLVTFERGVLFDERPVKNARKDDFVLFSDCAALQEIARLLKIGLIGEKDFKYTQGIQSKLGVAWNICCQEDNLSIALQQFQQRGLSNTREWIHVVSTQVAQLEQARTLGIVTCFLPRPLGLSATDGEAFKPDILVSDLFQLHEGLIAQMGLAPYVSIDVDVVHSKLLREMLRWFRYDGASLLREYGAHEFSIKKTEPLKVLIEIHGKDRSRVPLLQEKVERALKEIFPADAVTFRVRRAEICLEQRF